MLPGIDSGCVRSFSNGTTVNFAISTIGTNRKLNTPNGLLAASGCFSAYGNQWVSFATTVSHCLPLATICNRWQSLAIISIDRLNIDFRTFILPCFGFESGSRSKRLV